MKKSLFLAVPLACGVLAACGGGGVSTTGTPTPSISGMTADRVMFARKTTFTITGSNLTSNLALTSSACVSGTISVETGGTATSQKVGCIIGAVGNVNFSVLPSGGTSFSSSQTVPLPRVTMKTSMGDIAYELYPANAPLSAFNFLTYVNDGFYTGLIFHRVEKNFVVQGGGFNSALTQSTTRNPIKLESGNGLSNLRGSLAMARTNDPNSGTSQFYINVVDNLFLDGTQPGVDGYAVFGKVISGMDVVDQMRNVPVGTAGGLSNVPNSPIVILTASQTQ